MVRPCVARRFRRTGGGGLASMYPALDWAIWAASVRTPSEDRSSILSCPLADLGWKLLIGLRHRLLLISRSSFVRAKGRSFVPARSEEFGTSVPVFGLRPIR